jgi:hypothetical protein
VPTIGSTPSNERYSPSWRHGVEVVRDEQQ